MPCPARVNVSTVTTAKKIDYESSPILSYSVNYPEFSAPGYRASMEKMNAYYRRKAQAFLRYINGTLLKSAKADYRNSIQNGFPIHEYEAQMNFTVTYNQNCIVSLYTDQYEYTGGAHGSTVRTSETWNIKTGTQIPLQAFFPGNPHFQTELIQQIDNQISEQISAGQNNYFDNYRELVAKYFNPAQYYLTPAGLVIYYQQYDIAPYATGLPVFTITNFTMPKL